VTGYAFDAANPSIDIGAMVRHGAVVAPVYIVGSPGGFPHVDRARVAALRKAGLAPLPNWERAADFFRNCTVEEAHAAGVEALNACRDLGFPDDGSIDVPFSFDYNISPSEYAAAAARLVAANVGLGGHYRAIAYGPIGFLTYLGAHGQPGPHWLMASTFRSSSLFYASEVSSPHVALIQSHDAAGNWLNSPIPGTDINTVVNPHALGAWWPDGSPYARTEFSMTMDPEVKGRFDAIDAALAAMPGRVLGTQLVDPTDGKTTHAVGEYIRFGDFYAHQALLAVDPAQLAAAIAKNMPAAGGGVPDAQLVADVEAGVRAVLAAAAQPPAQGA